jgi:hypothetical protein
MYRKNLKNWEFGKEGPSNVRSERVAIAEWPGTNKNEKAKKIPTKSKTNFSGFYGILLLQANRDHCRSALNGGKGNCLDKNFSVR